MAGPVQPSAYYVSVGEFVPRDDVKQMLQVADNLEKLEPYEAKTAFIDIKRALVWMEKYIAPTSEFWEWSNDAFTIDTQTSLSIQLIGYGWLITVTSLHPHDIELVTSEEQRLVSILDALTWHIPVSAVLRMKASRWTKPELREVRAFLGQHQIECQLKGMSLAFPKLNLVIYTEPGEGLLFPAISRATGREVEHILALIKEYANRDYEGAGWCAYRRRRLTLVQKIGTERLDATDKDFLQTSQTGFAGDILSSRVIGPEDLTATFHLVRAKYHQGNIHPRALLATTKSIDALRDLSTYVFYLWNTSFTRMWLYLIFEDAYVFAHGQRSTKEYVDPRILHYWQNILDTDQIIAELHILERVDAGEFQSYVVPHSQYSEEPLHLHNSAPANVTPIQYLRTWLIQATTTQLLEDPLRRAVVLLEGMDAEMKTALDLFVQTVNIRMQKTLQILQFVFVVAAIAQVLQLVPVGANLASLMDPGLASLPLYASVVTKLGASTVGDLIVAIVNVALLIILTVLSMLLLKTSGIRNLLDRALQ